MCINNKDHQLRVQLDPVDELALSSRCRLIRLITPPTLTPFMYWMGNIHFSALEELLFLGRFFVGPNCTSNILDKLREGSPLLWNLSITLEDTKKFEQNMRMLSPQLKKLSIGSISTILCNPSPEYVIFPKLEELVVIHDSLPPYYCRRILSPMPSLKKLTLQSGSLHTMSRTMYSQLTHLTLIYKPWWSFQFEGIIELPHLIYLALHGSWKHLPQLHASNLVTLILQNLVYTHYFTAGEVDMITVLPEVLYIDRTLRPNRFSQLLAQNGKNLKSLFITHVNRNDTITETLASDLIGRKTQAAICPLLQRFHLLIPESRELNVINNTRNRLQRVIKARVASGNLQRVRYGFYPLPKDPSETLEFASRKEWAVEWNELLMR